VGSSAARFARYVALGDSSTEGLDDPDGRGGYRGWADRLAGTLAAAAGPGGPVLYANLGVRGKTTREIRDEQLPRALAMEPDLATLFSGTNDLLGRRFDLDGFRADALHMQRALRAAGATVLTFTLPDLGPVLPLARPLAPRLERMNAALREISAATGTLLVDFAAYPVASDPRLWSDDRLHANSAGHARIAAALAHAIGIGPIGSNGSGGSEGTSWGDPLPPVPPPTLWRRLGDELSWMGRYLLPWSWRHLRGRSTGDGIACKRPELVEVRASERSP
jgi:lysophospholipase L1-like esterase